MVFMYFDQYYKSPPVVELIYVVVMVFFFGLASSYKLLGLDSGYAFI